MRVARGGDRQVYGPQLASANSSGAKRSDSGEIPHTPRDVTRTTRAEYAIQAECMAAAVRAWGAKGKRAPDTSEEVFGFDVEDDHENSVAGHVLRELGSLPPYESFRQNDSKFSTLSRRIQNYLRGEYQPYQDAGPVWGAVQVVV